MKANVFIMTSNTDSPILLITIHFQTLTTKCETEYRMMCRAY